MRAATATGLFLSAAGLSVSGLSAAGLSGAGLCCAGICGHGGTTPGSAEARATPQLLADVRGERHQHPRLQPQRRAQRLVVLAAQRAAVLDTRFS